MAKSDEENALESNLGTESILFNYHGFWYPRVFVPGVIAIQQQFHPRPTDILLASTPKSGTTWLKAILFATTTRKQHDPCDPNHPLLFKHPRENVPLLEEKFASGRTSELEALSSPRVLSTHLPYQHLSKSLADSDCKIIYICRDPKDTLVSSWHFFRAMTRLGEKESEPFSFDKAVEKCCEGTTRYGPMWDHWLGYWKESLRTPSNVLFLKYEDMIQDAVGNLKRLAGFAGCPFSQEEEKEGVTDEIVKLCSFDKLSGLEVNKRGGWQLPGISINYSSYFRKGKVGDWKNHFTSEMAQMLDQFIEEKLHGSGLSFHDVEQGSSGGDQ